MIVHKLPSPTSLHEAHAAVQRVLKPGRIYILQYLHDDGCEAIETHRDVDCRPPCAPDCYLLELEKDDTIERMPDDGRFVAFAGGKVELQ